MKAFTLEAFIRLLFFLWSVFWMFKFFAQILDNILHPKPFIIVRGKGGIDCDSRDVGRDFSSGDFSSGDFGGGDFSSGDCGSGDGGGGDCGGGD